MKAVMATVVDEGSASLKTTLARPGVVTDPYWKQLLALYRSLPRRERGVLLKFAQQAQVDAISHLFGILDGSTGLGGRSETFELFHGIGTRRIKINGDLQDTFLELAETRERKGRTDRK